MTTLFSETSGCSRIVFDLCTSLTKFLGVVVFGLLVDVGLLLTVL